ncbi:MAG: 2-dehydro-3-deoxyphosphogluconate aldolase/(4S)-4-hydroxy-2-oxoglutarate aldolase [Rhodothermales bacterium]|jgi:2-dehydro-3-deoxyphosphogluconate aldolase/(4S)-4-hydroxy-2-oxoglutarate aldolase
MRAITVSRILAAKVLAVIRVADGDKLLPVVEAIVRGGVTGIEITMTVPNALAQIKRVHETFGDDVLLGVGSVLDRDTARQAVDAGARYVVSPVFKAEIIEAAHLVDVPALVGAFSPTEIQAAHEAGADIVKVFPADVVGIPFFRGVLAPMPHLRLMPTGGVTLTNAVDWLRAGACAVGIGSSLLDKSAIAAGDWGLLESNARALMAGINEFAS